MAFGRRNHSRAAQSLLALAMILLALFPGSAFAQGGRVPVEGVPAAFNDELRRLLRDEENPESLFEARRQAERAEAIVARLLESEGYYQAEVESWAEGIDTFTRGVRATIGPLFIYTTARIDFLGGRPDEQTVKDLESLLAPLDPGIPARAQPVIETGDALLARLRAAGYPDAIAQPVDALADARENTVEIAFQLQPGRRASFGDVRYTGLGRTRPDFLAKLRPWKPGERYSPQKLDEFRGRLAETGLFSSAAVRLSPTGDPEANGLLSRDVLVDIRERERHTIALGATASTSDGGGVEAEWERRNLTGRGDSLRIAGQLATLERRLEATWRRPHIGRYGRNVSFGAKIEDFETDAFDQTGGSVLATIEEQLTPRIRASVGAEAGYASILDDQARQQCANQPPDCVPGRRDLYILSTTGTAEYVGVRDILDPRDGVRARASIEPGLTTGDTQIGYTRLLGEASVYFDIGSDNLIGALRGRAGTIFGPEGAPPDRLFYAGGGGSVRGYEYQSLSPRDSTGLLIGGRSLVEMSAELRYRATNNLGYVAFVDAGAAGTNVEPPIDAMSAGIGLGVRYYAGFGPLRADIAVPLNKKEGDADFQIYISIGQAF
ncbi:MAG TPA: autotransporter assembly complex family protein [Hyphomonadaceae bacterium]|nr:autotransporter assembly complex family protein [Hyphomonadaceae bacterium]